MCGLFGVVSSDSKTLTSEHEKLFAQNAGLARRRGSDASGLVTIEPGWKIKYVKAWVPVSRLLRRKEIQKHLKENSFNGLFGHSRLETHGFSALRSNNQPIVSKDWFVLHNGIITNQESIKKRGWDRDRLGNSDSDTFAVLLLIEEWEKQGRQGDLAEQVFSQCDGELTVIAGSRFGDLVIYTNVGNLYHCRLPDGTSLFGSEPRQFGKKYESSAVPFPLGLTVLSEKKADQGPDLEEINLNLELRKENGATAL
ncbi:MAG: hypothetical protein LW628_15010, partial [Fimbriimonadaceae bacterium]|nr:hypothetical protein [Fimbriimonadaceae bacterium]